MRYILLGSDAPKVYVKDCKESKPQLLIIKDTDFIREELRCLDCFYKNVCFLDKKIKKIT